MRKKTIFLLILAFSLFSITNIIYASTTITGNVSSPVWTAEGSPYIVDGTVEVLAGAKLTIKPGTVVKFNEGAKILVKGEIEVIGEEDNMVVFTSVKSVPARGDWDGIEFLDESEDANFDTNGNYLSGSIIKYAVIKYSKEIKCNDASPYLTNNLIMNNNTGISVSGNKAEVGTEVLAGEEKNKNLKIATISINNNEITDNTIGIHIDRNNSNNYVSTPAGYVLQGEVTTTAIIKNNYILNNVRGVLIEKGDNNTIVKNRINNNIAEGLEMGTNSRNNVLERNQINNNKIGLKISSLETQVSQNNINNNSLYGIYLNIAASTIKNNNIYNNVRANLHNAAGMVDVKENYWGIIDVGEIENKIENVDRAAIYEPSKTSLVDIGELLAPIINTIVSPTISSIQTISGTKPVGAAVLVDNREVIAANDSIEWQYEVSLDMGDNNMLIKFKDENGNVSPGTIVKIIREKVVLIAAPAINSFSSETSKGSQNISGSKPVGVGIWINGSEVVALNSSGSWNYELPLAKGENNFNIWAQDEDGRQSEKTMISIIRNEIDSSEIVKEEKLLTKNIDSILAKRLAGRLLLQVERDGMIWYVDTNNHKRYYVTRDDALNIFRKLSLGINESNLGKIPVAGSDLLGDKNLRDRLRGKFLLRVEADGAISYVDPEGYRHDINMDNLMDIFRSLSLGISNENIRKIEVGEIN